MAPAAVISNAPEKVVSTLMGDYKAHPNGNHYNGISYEAKDDTGVRPSSGISAQDALHPNGDHTTPNGHHKPAVQTNGIYKPNGVSSTNGRVNGHTKSLAPTPSQKPMPIGIVGMSCRLPGNVASPAEFWELCARARSGYSHIPKERFDTASFQHPNPGKAGCHNPVGGHFLNTSLAAFDAPFFSLTEKEAISMDPQQRLLLECTFEALESAGIPKQDIVGKNIGVFIGGSFPEYESHLFRDTDTIPMHQATGCAYAMQSNRLSHFFDLKGPSFTTDTACSSSLVALHVACQSLRAGEADMAIVGGCHLNMLPEFWISFSKSRLFSDTGRSFSFDSRGTGFGRGEGCGVIIIKPLEQAQKDNDSIRAIIAGSGVNQDGKTPGITMPCGDAQETLMRQVYRNAGISPRDCGFVEAHGTGTRVGDPIEATAIHQMFGEGRTPRDPLYIGSVKSNIGHLEGASGIVSVIKAAMMLERGFILPNYDFKHPNEKIPFKEWNMKVPVNQRPWPRNKKYVSVNNFGFGGTNAHVVIERIPFTQRGPKNDTDLMQDNPGRRLFVLSANDKNSLEKVMKNLVIYLEQRPEMFQKDLMADVAYTLGQRRSLLQWRVAIPAVRSFDLIEAINGQNVSPGKPVDQPRVGFIFTGQGAQWYGMGRELYQQYPVFTDAIDRADTCLNSLGASWSLLEELSKDEKTSAVGAAHLSQPSCTAVQLALVDLLRSWGIHPKAVAGHSSGEIGAAYAAGILTFEACMAIAYHRGRLIPVLKERYLDLRGSMMAVGGSKEDIEPLIDQVNEGQGQIKIACYNSPSSLTISGDEAGIDQLKNLIEEKQLFNRKLFVDTAYHSHHMNLIAKEYQESIKSVDPPTSTEVAFHSSLLGHILDGRELEPTYWVQNLTCPVRFDEAVQSMLLPSEGQKTGVNMLLELGPHAALQGPLKQILKAVGGDAAKIPCFSALLRKKDAVTTALDAAASLFNKGVNLNFEAVNFQRPGKTPTLLTDLPRYPWNHSGVYWHESRMTKKHKTRSSPRSDILGTVANYSNDLEPTWRNIVRLDDLPWLEHHKVQSLTIFPMSGYLAMALEAAKQRAEEAGTQFDKYEIRDVSVISPLVIPDEDVEMTTTLRPHQEGTLISSENWDEFRICSWTKTKGWNEHCKGLIAIQSDHQNGVDDVRRSQISMNLLQSTIASINQNAASTVPVDKLYDDISAVGVAYGPTFQGIEQCQSSDTCAHARLVVQDVAKEMPNHYMTESIIQPSFLESLISMYWPIIGAGRQGVKTVYLPSSISRLSVSKNIASKCSEPGQTLVAYSQGTIPSDNPSPAKINIFGTTNDVDSEPLIRLDGLNIAPILDHDIQTEELHRQLCYKLEWEPILDPISEGYEAVTNGSSFGENSLLDADIEVVYGDSAEQLQLAQDVAGLLERFTGKKPNTSTLLNHSAENKLCVFLAELEKPLLAYLKSEEFDALQKLLTSVQGVLWVVQGAYDNSTNPHANLVSGLSRTIRSETLLPFVTLDLDGSSKLAESQIPEAIMKIFEAVFVRKNPSNNEMEFMEREGRFFTPRVVNDTDMNETVHRETKPSALQAVPFGEDNRLLKMALTNVGALDTLHFTDDDIAKTPIEAENIEIKVQAIGVNHRDITAAHGKLPNTGFGIEASGVVTSVGNSVTNFKVGDRVAAITHGAFATSVRAKAIFAFKLPSDMTFEAGATLPLAYSTAYYSLVELGRLHEEESVLIHAGAGAVGQAAISLAQMIGAELFVTVGSADKKKFLMAEYGLPENHIFYSRDASFADAVRQETNGRGVDIVLNCLAGEGLRESWHCLNTFGRLIDIGTRDTSASTRLEMVQFDNNSSFMSVDMIALATQRPRLMKNLLSDVSKLIKYGKVRPISPITVFPISKVESAFKTLHGAKAYGKLVVVPHAEDIVRATPPKRPRQLLKENATYILIGGTGGLGRSMTRWMINRGARHIVLVSRSASASGKVKELIDEASEVGAMVVVRRCDVADPTDVEDLTTHGLEGLPPIKGVVHGAMVLHDVLFEKMGYNDFTSVVESKVQGGWNFHNALYNRKLDFFVAISSVAGMVGNRGQAAYAAANTFLNALVRHRLSLGLPASTMDLTAVSDSGYLAEDLEKAAEVAKNLGGDSICEAEVLALLGAAISGRMATTCNSHTITGMRITPDMTQFWAQDGKCKYLREEAEALAAAEASSGGVKTVSYNAALKAAGTIEEAEQVVCDGLVHKLAAVMMMDLEDLDVTRPLSNYPLDSLVAIEIRNFITREFEATLQVLELLSSGSIQTLAKAVCVKSKLVKI